MTLAEATEGTCCHVSALDASGRCAGRMAELGILPGTPIRVLRQSLFGSAMLVRVRDFSLSLRRDEAALVRIATAVDGDG